MGIFAEEQLKTDDRTEFKKMLKNLPNDPSIYPTDALAKILIKQMEGKPYNQGLTQMTKRINEWLPDHLSQLPSADKPKKKIRLKFSKLNQ